jgi:hypothetical protein
MAVRRNSIPPTENRCRRYAVTTSAGWACVLVSFESHCVSSGRTVTAIAFVLSEEELRAIAAMSVERPTIWTRGPDLSGLCSHPLSTEPSTATLFLHLRLGKLCSAVRGRRRPGGAFTCVWVDALKQSLAYHEGSDLVAILARGSQSGKWHARQEARPLRTKHAKDL